MFATADGRNHFGPDGGEDGLQRLKKGGVRSIVGPQAADPSGVGLRGEGLPSFGPAECGVARVEQVARGVVDVEERGMEFRSWRSGVESDLRRTGQSEGVNVTKRTKGNGPAPTIGRSISLRFQVSALAFHSGLPAAISAALRLRAPLPAPSMPFVSLRETETAV
jgi:hypothetical protein